MKWAASLTVTRVRGVRRRQRGGDERARTNGTRVRGGARVCKLHEWMTSGGVSNTSGVSCHVGPAGTCHCRRRTWGEDRVMAVRWIVDVDRRCEPRVCRAPQRNKATCPLLPGGEGLKLERHYWIDSRVRVAGGAWWLDLSPETDTFCS